MAFGGIPLPTQPLPHLMQQPQQPPLPLSITPKQFSGSTQIIPPNSEHLQFIVHLLAALADRDEKCFAELLDILICCLTCLLMPEVLKGDVWKNASSAFNSVGDAKM